LAVLVLVLADNTDLLAKSPEFHRTVAGILQDDANYYAAYFARQHQIVWDLALRDALGPVAMLALIAVALALLNLVGRERAEAQLMAAFLVVGAFLIAIDGLPTLANVNWWAEKWDPNPPAQMVAVGRSAELMTKVSGYFEVAGALTLALGVFFLGRLCRTPKLPSRLGLVAYAVVVSAAGLEIASLVGLDMVYNALAFVNAVLAPVLLVWLGSHFGRLQRLRT
jgi:hypothetical protein